MLSSLPLFHRLSGQPVVVLGQGEAAEAKRRLVERAGAHVLDDLAEGIDKGARLAFIAHEDEASAQADAIRARCAGLLVNVVDRAEMCDFTLPAIVDRDPVIVAVGTGGASAGLAAALRQRLESLFPASLGRLADALFAARGAIRTAFPDAAERRRAISDALRPGGLLDPLSSTSDVARWLARAGRRGDGAGTIETIRLTSTDPDDLTLRDARLLANADRVTHDAAVPPAILDRARADADRRHLSPVPPQPVHGPVCPADRPRHAARRLSADAGAVRLCRWLGR